MATATGTLTYTSSGTTYTITQRVTYSITNYDNRAVVTVTKIENKRNVKGSSSTQDTISHSAYDSSLSYVWVDNWFTSSSYTFTTSYQTIWSGSKSFTTYKPTYATTIKVGYASISIPVRTSYTITYNANGGSNPPANTTKYYGITASLSSGKPTRTGYTFVNWLCNADSKYYLPSAQYSLNQGATMTAQWTANTYTISYSGNGATSGSVANQTKTYGVAASFSNGTALKRVETVSGITREYELTSWNTNPDGTGTTYQLGGSVPEITGNLSLYAQWDLRYLYPSITGGNARRTATASIADTDRTDDGEYIYITFSFTGCSSDAGTSYSVPSCTITIDDDVYTPTLSFDAGTNAGTLEYKPSVTYSKDTPHNVIIELYDPTYASSKTVFNDYITTGIFPIDLYSNDNDFEVYMGIMHPYVRGVPLTLPDTSIDGSLSVAEDVSADSVEATTDLIGEDLKLQLDTTATSGIDKEIYDALVSLVWTDVIV